MRPFRQVDVFGQSAFTGNPVAVVLDAHGLDSDDMQRCARWTNLSETTFVLSPTDPGADYAVRIFTPSQELPFAGHPTLGTCHAWAEHAGRVGSQGAFVQQCGAGLVKIRRAPNGFAFAAPELVRKGPVAHDTLRRVATTLGVSVSQVRDSQWVDNGPGWLGILLEDADAVKRLRPDEVEGSVGVIGPYPEGSVCAFEVRAFFASGGKTFEDPVTGSLNASLAQWMIATGRAEPPYVVGQGGAVGASGRVYVEADAEGTVWVGGRCETVVSGVVEI